MSKISPRFPSHFAHNHSAFAEQAVTLHQTELCPHPYSWANPAHPPFGCFQPVFCVSSLLHDQLWEPLFFSPTAMFPGFTCCSVLAGLKLLLVCYSALIFLILEGVQMYGPTMGISTGTSSMGISQSLLPLWNALHKKVSSERRAKHLASAKWEIRSRSALSPFCKFVFHSLRLWLSIRQNTVVLWGQEGWHKANLTLSHL